MAYTISICYDDLRHIPRSEWNKKEKKRIYPRKEHIESLSRFLEKELGLESIYIEDLIYSKASIFPNTPYTLKEGIPEDQYYRLRAVEKDWPGLRLDITAKRYYPEGSTACNVVGYIGNIHTSEYLAIREQLDLFSRLLKEREEGLPVILPTGYHSWKEVKQRLLELKEKSYSISALVGKSGVEKSFDEDLRGFFGKKKFEIDTQGRLVRPLPDSTSAINGRRVLLTISRELQEYGEMLLADHERIRDERFRFAGKGHTDYSPPWIKGGGIVAIDPLSGEIVCFASYPRFNPNDFTMWNDG
jgi:cell division protein FtsI/penicillin-binding protein 2